MTTVHIINHTHWDREWFLTSIYTSQWIPNLMDRLVALGAENPEFSYFLDGQTLIIEDLLALAPGYEATVRKLIKAGTLTIGPYYCQPDWKLTGGESLIRNFLFGIADLKKYGGEVPAGWLVDTFGHISHNPRLHQMFGIDTVYVWRGVPQLVPFFKWQGADGSELFAINLFGGYRNLYGVTHAPAVAWRRLQTEIEKLGPYYTSGHIPLFDGYDLEENPEDPLSFYATLDVPMPAAMPASMLASVQIQESTPTRFAEEMRSHRADIPTIAGELNSGKYGAIFMGVGSARTYLKVMHSDCEQLLYRYCEPLAVLARLQGRAYPSQKYEAWARQILQNSVHDAICGVSIDQVHEKMDYSYRELFNAGKEDLRESAAYLAQGLPAGLYAISTNPMPYRGCTSTGNQMASIETDGIGIFPIECARSNDFSRSQAKTTEVVTTLPEVDSFTWRNAHYSATLTANGQVRIGQALVGKLVVYEEKGDTYSDEPGQTLGTLVVEKMFLREESDAHAVIGFKCAARWGQIDIQANVSVTFDQSPLLQWSLELDSEGTNFRVDMLFETGIAGSVQAGMQFDIVERPFSDTDLMPKNVEPQMAKILMGQREVEEVRTFAFHGFVTISDATDIGAVFAKGLRSYQAHPSGEIAITLRRSIEWLAVSNLRYRAGDAGPDMYVPDARCERLVRHEVAFWLGEGDMQEVVRLNAGFQQPPILLEVGPSEKNEQKSHPQPFWQASLPLSSLRLQDGKLLATLFNPTQETITLPEAYPEVDSWGTALGNLHQMPPKSIHILNLSQVLPEPCAPPTSHVNLFGLPEMRVSHNHGLPNLSIVAQLEERIEHLSKQLAEAEAKLLAVSGDDLHRQQHQIYVLARELYELKLSVYLNQQKHKANGLLDYDYLYTSDPEIVKLGKTLNDLRIKRRIYDYVVAAL